MLAILLACSSAPSPPGVEPQSPTVVTIAACWPEDACNGVDDDCDGQVDEGRQPRGYADADGDGHAGTVVTCPDPPLLEHTDCADNDSTRHPGATEVCNHLDDDCDGLTDPDGSVGCVDSFVDADGDGLGDEQGCFCTPGVLVGGDCDDGAEWLGADCDLTDPRDLATVVITGALVERSDCDGDGVEALRSAGEDAPMPGAGSWVWGDLARIPASGNHDWNGDGVCDGVSSEQWYSRVEYDRWSWYEVELTYTLTDGASGGLVDEVVLTWDDAGDYWSAESTVADVDGDGAKEILVYFDEGWVEDAWFFALPMDGSGAETLCDAPVSALWTFGTGRDLTGDGIDESPSTRGAVFLGPLADTMCAAAWAEYTDVWESHLSWGDVDGDGTLDQPMQDGVNLFVAPVQSSPGNYLAETEAIATVPLRGDETQAVLADSDGDGVDDLVVLTRWPTGYQLHVYDGPVKGILTPADARLVLNFALDPGLGLASDSDGLRVQAAATATDEPWTAWIRL